MAGGSKIPIFRDYLVNVRDNDGRRGKQNVSLAITESSQHIQQNVQLSGEAICTSVNSAGSITKTTWDPLSVVPPSTHNTDGSGAPLPSDLCRSFSLEDLKAATGNFDEKFVVVKREE
nr:receptor-like protein kinase FERONIA [Ipomoea trifida]GMC80877.1 receptor-like protein kinase FERONIA [Ipomoea batatas]